MKENLEDIDLRPCWQKMGKNFWNRDNNNICKKNIFIDDTPTDFESIGKSLQDMELQIIRNKFFVDTYSQSSSDSSSESYDSDPGSFEKDLSFSDNDNIEKYIEEELYETEDINDTKKIISPNKNLHQKRNIKINKDLTPNNVSVANNYDDLLDRKNRKGNNKQNYYDENDYRGINIENGHIVFNHSS